MAQEEKKPFYSSVIDTVKGYVGGAITGAAVTGAVGAVLGAAGMATVAVFNLSAVGPVLDGIDTVAPAVTDSLLGMGSNIGIAAAAGAASFGAAGVALGGSIGAISGAVTGWVNSRPGVEKEDPVAHQQELARAQATGLVQGAALAKMEALEQKVDTHEQTHQWREKFAHKQPQADKPKLFVEQVSQERAAAQVAINMPGSPALQ